MLSIPFYYSPNQTPKPPISGRGGNQTHPFYILESGFSCRWTKFSYPLSFSKPNIAVDGLTFQVFFVSVTHRSSPPMDMGLLYLAASVTILLI